MIILREIFFKGGMYMNKKLKRALASAVVLAMAASAVPMAAPVSAETVPLVDGDNVLNEWKFDFGAADTEPAEGYTRVSPDINFVQNTGGEYQYGFLGTEAEDYNLTNRYDGWTTQNGQVIELDAGGGTGLNDAIGVVGAGGTGENEGKDIFGNEADVYYPVRFALKVEDDTYYRIKATVTTLDPEQPATASLYTERKHPIYTEKTIPAGETVTETFSVRVTPIYYQKSSPTGEIPDEMVTVGVLGENAALASVEIQQVKTIPTIWVLGDSTVTDGNTTLPFFQLQNFTGVGTGLTKFLRRDYAVVNEGEGGLDANDRYHFEMVAERIKPGDYMYVEYGHNHKDDGPSGYKAALEKYYTTSHNAGANLLIVSPVQSINSWNETDLKWNDRFGGDDNFEGAGRSFVEEKIEAGATDIAFVNLTETSVAFVDKVTEDNENSQDAAKYYYQTDKGGATDASHPNDLGAENFAYCFFEAAKAVTDDPQKTVVAPIIENMSDETPILVSQEIMAGGVGGDAWPQYIVPTTEKYPVVINDVVFNDDGTVSHVDVTTRAAEIDLSSYGVIVITIYNADGSEKGTIYAVDQVDNSTGYGPQTISRFTGDTVLADGDTYTAVVVQADADVKPVENGTVYSAVYRPTDIEQQLLLNDRNENGGYENFDYYGATYDGATNSLIEYNEWAQVGSSAISSYLDETADGVKYAELTSDGGGSFYMAKPMSESISGTDGKYVISADVQYVGGGGMTFNLLTSWGNSVNRITIGQELFTIGENGVVTIDDQEAGTVSATGFTNVQYVLDTVLGTGTLTVSGGDPVTVDIPEYQTTDASAEFKEYTHFMFGGNRVSFDMMVTNLQVAKLKDSAVPEYSYSAASSNDEWGTVTITDGSGEPPETTPEATPDATPDATPEATPDATPEATQTPIESVNETTGTKMSYADGNVTVTALSPAEYVVIETTYDNGVLTSLEITPIEVDESTSATVPVAPNSKVILWDSLEQIVPQLDALNIPGQTGSETPEESSAPEENTEFVELAETRESGGTAPINTVITAKATANAGYVFTGWADKEGAIVSTDTEYSFRLRGDTELTAQFSEQGGVEDVADFDLSADRTKMAVGNENTVNITVSNVVDENGNAVEYTADDLSWSCDDTSITVDNGIVTIPADYSGTSIKNVIPVSCTINGIAKTIELTLYSCDYYEDFSAITDFSEWISDDGTASSLFEIANAAVSTDFSGMTAAGNGNMLVIGNDSSGTGKLLAYDRDLGLAEHSLLSFGFDIEPYQIRKDGKNSSVTLQFIDSNEAPVFTISVNTSGGNSSFNGSEVNGFAAGTVVSVDTVLNFTNKTMSYTLTNSEGTQLASGTVALTASNLSNMSFSGDWQYGKFAIDNVYADYSE